MRIKSFDTIMHKEDIYTLEDMACYYVPFMYMSSVIINRVYPVKDSVNVYNQKTLKDIYDYENASTDVYYNDGKESRNTIFYNAKHNNQRKMSRYAGNYFNINYDDEFKWDDTVEEYKDLLACKGMMK